MPIHTSKHRASLRRYTAAQIKRSNSLLPLSRSDTGTGRFSSYCPAASLSLVVSLGRPCFPFHTPQASQVRNNTIFCCPASLFFGEVISGWAIQVPFQCPQLEYFGPIIPTDKLCRNQFTQSPQTPFLKPDPTPNILPCPYNPQLVASCP